jgi:hypothetical protein
MKFVTPIAFVFISLLGTTSVVAQQQAATEPAAAAPAATELAAPEPAAAVPETSEPAAEEAAAAEPVEVVETVEIIEVAAPEPEVAAPAQAQPEAVTPAQAVTEAATPPPNPMANPMGRHCKKKAAMMGGEGAGGKKHCPNKQRAACKAKHQQVVDRLDMIEARLAKIEAMMEALVRRQ